MSPNTPITLTIVKKTDFFIVIPALALLLLLSSALSPHPVLTAAISGSVLAVMWLFRILGFSKLADDVILTLIIFPDGRARLKSNGDDGVEGVLDSQQWCTQGIAVLRIINGGTIQKLLILAAQQARADEFRRLNMWLRQGICNDTIKKQVSAI